MVSPMVDAAGGNADTLTITATVEPSRGPCIAGGIAGHASSVKHNTHNQDCSAILK